MYPFRDFLIKVTQSKAILFQEIFNKTRKLIIDDILVHTVKYCILTLIVHVHANLKFPSFAKFKREQ